MSSGSLSIFFNQERLQQPTRGWVAGRPKRGRGRKSDAIAL